VPDDGPGGSSRAPWERDQRDRPLSGRRSEQPSTAQRIESSPFFEEQPAAPRPRRERDQQLSSRKGQQDTPGPIRREPLARRERPAGPAVPGSPAGVGGPAVPGGPGLPGVPVPGAVRPEQPGAPDAIRGDQPSGPNVVRRDQPSGPNALRPQPPNPPAPRRRSSEPEAARGREPGAQARRRSWLVDDEVPIDPNEYFRELDDEGRGATARSGRWSMSLGKVVAAVLAVTVVLITGIAWGTKKWTGEAFRQVAALDPQSQSIVDPAKQAGAENFLLVGSDIRRGAEAADEADQSAGDAEAGRGARSDTLMLLHLPADRSRMVVLSFPRDVQIDRPACETWDAASGAYSGSRDPGEAAVKINTAYQVGGPRCAVQVVQQLTGVAINHFLSIDFAGFTAMADAVGGVNVCVDKPIKDGFLGDVVPRPGPVELTGAGALDFVRARHVEGDPTSDYGRVRRQQVFMAAMAREALSERLLADPTRLARLVDALAANTFADNVTVDDLLELGRSAEGLEAGRVLFATVPTTGTANEKGNEELRTEDAAALFRAVIDGAQPGGAAAEPTQTSAPPTVVPPAEVKLRVLNGTGQGGLAGQVGDKLTELGFQVLQVGNAKAPAPTTVIRYSELGQAQARTVAAAVPAATLELDPSMGGALELVLGNGFDGKVQAVEAGGPAPGAPEGEPAAGLTLMSAADTSCA
jgi:LCP family protein required for cell wall assembly